jgi:predicted nucleic acid-binding protein
VSFLLDTNVVSEVRKPDPDTHVHRWIASVPGFELFISVLVVGEIRQGIERLRPRDPRQAAAHEAWLAVLRHEYRDRVLPITADIGEEWGRLNSSRPLPVIDGLMAATAIVHDLTLVTRNVADVSGTAARVVNPFER